MKYLVETLISVMLYLLKLIGATQDLVLQIFFREPGESGKDALGIDWYFVILNLLNNLLPSSSVGQCTSFHSLKDRVHVLLGQLNHLPCYLLVSILVDWIS